VATLSVFGRLRAGIASSKLGQSMDLLRIFVSVPSECRNFAIDFASLLAEQVSIRRYEAGTKKAKARIGLQRQEELLCK
jgi:hypothetical protein